MLLTLFTRLLLRLLPLIVLLCVVVPVFGGRQPADDEAWQRFGFTTCKLPCFAGITPGETAFNEVIQLLVRHVETVDPRVIDSGSSINFWARINSQQLGGIARYDRALVGELRLSVILRLEDVMAQVGTPDCILPNPSNEPDRRIVLFWERGTVSIAAVLAADATRRALNVSENALALWLSAVEPNPCSLRGGVPWKGFALMGEVRSPLQHYD